MQRQSAEADVWLSAEGQDTRPQAEVPAVGKRHVFGRRRQDWILPGLLLLCLLAAVIWGVYNNMQQQNAEVMGKMTKAQVTLMNRLIQHHQQHPK